jgi:hypothetical protein
MVRIAHGGPQVHSARAVLYGIIEKFDATTSGSVFGVRRKSNCGSQCTARHLFLYCQQLTLGDGEVRVNRIEALNREQRGCVRLHHVSDID